MKDQQIIFILQSLALSILITEKTNEYTYKSKSKCAISEPFNFFIKLYVNIIIKKQKAYPSSMFVNYYCFYILITLISFQRDASTKKIISPKDKFSQFRTSSKNDIVQYISRRQRHALQGIPIEKKFRKDDDDDDDSDERTDANPALVTPANCPKPTTISQNGK